MANFDEGGNFVPGDPRPPIEDSSFHPTDIESFKPYPLKEEMWADRAETTPQGSIGGVQTPALNFDSKPFGPIDKGFSIPQPVNVPQGFLAPPRPIVGGGFSAPAPVPQGRGFTAPESLESIYTNRHGTENDPLGSRHSDIPSERIKDNLIAAWENLMYKAESAKKHEIPYGEPIGFDMRDEAAGPMLDAQENSPFSTGGVARRRMTNANKNLAGYQTMGEEDIYRLTRDYRIPRDEEQIAAEEGRVTDAQKGHNDFLEQEIKRREEKIDYDNPYDVFKRASARFSNGVWEILDRQGYTIGRIPGSPDLNPQDLIMRMFEMWTEDMDE